MAKHLLVLIDNTDYAEVSIKKAAQLASHLNLPVKVLAFTYQSLSNIPIDFSEEEVERVKLACIKHIQNVLKTHLKTHLQDVPHQFEVIWQKHPELYLADTNNTQGAEMFIKTRHIDMEQRVSALDWELIRNVETPLYFVADNPWRNRNTVFACLDLGSTLESKVALNQDIIETAQQLATMKEMPLVTSYAIAISPILRDLGFVFTDEEELNAFEKLPQPQRALLERNQLCDSIKIKAGEPEKVIPSMAAESEAELVVMGSVGRRGLKGTLIGNTAEKVLRLLKTDLLILSPHSE